MNYMLPIEKMKLMFKLQALKQPINSKLYTWS
jgi:hypothetical protein